jgi:hypothetical protein
MCSMSERLDTFYKKKHEMQKTKQYVKHAQQRIKERSPARNRKLFQVECAYKAYAAGFERRTTNHIV